MSQDFQPGDFLVFQLESAFGLLRVLAVDQTPDGDVWHIAAYEDLFLDTDQVEVALDSPSSLRLSLPHSALTERAFLSTQVARMRNIPLSPAEIEPLERWRRNPERVIADRSIRLMMGLR